MNSKLNIKNFPSLWPTLKFSLPILLWVYTFHGYFLGTPAMTHHGVDYYHIIKYQMDNLMRGVLPLWDPFGAWGRPDNIDARFIGEFNPFLWLYPTLVLLGFSRPLSFLLYATVYHFVGLIGFYLLAKRFFKDTDLALISFVLLMFSSLLINIFNNFCVTLLFVPAIWFFYFFFSFAGNPKKEFFLGLTFSLMLIAITYMPYYFLTIFFSVLFFSILLFPKECIIIIQNWLKFIKWHKILVAVCLLAILISLIPGLMWYSAANRGEYVLSWRHEGASDIHTASMPISTINAGGIVGPVTVRTQFSGLSRSKHLLFYISIFIYIILGLSIINRLNKRSLLLFIVSFFIFLITLTDLTPVHHFLYERIYCFRLFRNIVYFLYLSLPILILFCVEQLRLFLNYPIQSAKGKRWIIIFVFLIHFLLLAFLIKQGDVIISSYLTIGLSLIFFVFYFSGIFYSREFLTTLFLLIIILVQPLEVFYHYTRNALSVVAWFPKDRFYPKFSFLRPARNENPPDYVYKGMSPRFVQDSSGFIDWKYTGLTNSFKLHENVDHDILEEYVRHKFVVYDEIEHMDDAKIDFARIEKTLAQKENKAFVMDPAESKIETNGSPHLAQLQFIVENSDQFRVLSFDLNFIKLKSNFNDKKFLVYNDGYDRGWQAFVDGQKTKILRTNLAFKGIWVPAGEHHIEFRYGSREIYILNLFMLVFYGIFFLYLLIALGLKIRGICE